MGSSSDEPVVKETLEVLEQMQVDYEVRVMSAHRTPERVQEYATTARDRGIEVLISAAGGSAALGGVLASWCTLPVIGIPLASSEMNGWDSLLATSQNAAGHPGGLHGSRRLGSAGTPHSSPRRFSDSVTKHIQRSLRELPEGNCRER